MASIAFILLCHKDPASVIRQARELAAAGDRVAIHYDARAPAAEFAALRAGLEDAPGVVFTGRRLRCGWGEWSLVEATLEGLRAAIAAFPEASHFYLLSGDCMAIKSRAYAHAFLEARDVDHIESFDFHESGWIKTGLRKERLIYRHWFNERSQSGLFYASLELQRRLGLTRKVPEDLRVMIGSQWWCLRRSTVVAILDFISRRRDVLRFFRTSWIPDETFFQTLVRHLVPDREIVARTLTFLMFTDYGMPVNFHNDHYELLLAQDFLFARKISPQARELKERLADLYGSERTDFDISNEGRPLFDFLVSRGREGRRFGPRFWERSGTLGQDREVHIVLAKKWHVGKRLLAAIGADTGMPVVGYLFDEEDTPLPDLGGIQTSVAKRTRHRRAMLNCLFEVIGGDRLVFGLDPANFDILEDICKDRCRTRLLDIRCRLDEEFLAGHARRIGLAGPRKPAAEMGALLATLRNDLVHEADRIRDAGFPGYQRMEEGLTVTANAAALASFLDLSEEAAQRLAAMPDLFSD